MRCGSGLPGEVLSVIGGLLVAFSVVIGSPPVAAVVALLLSGSCEDILKAANAVAGCNGVDGLMNSSLYCSHHKMTGVLLIHKI